MNDCVSGDCVAGIVDRTPNLVFPLTLKRFLIGSLRYRQTEEYREIPAERRYNGLLEFFIKELKI